ncbi:MAG: 2-nitropropane dioxygenase, partial [Polyangiaceae bacterium]
MPPSGDFSPDAIAHAALRCRERVHILRREDDGAIAVAFGSNPPAHMDSSGVCLVASLEPVYPEWLGSTGFLEAHSVRFPYASGAMAHGIASAQMVVAMARAELFAFYGSAGVPLDEVEKNVGWIQQELAGNSSGWGSDLIHTPHDPSIEDSLVEFYLTRGVSRVSASAFMRLTPAVVRYACSGLALAPDGSIVRKHHLFAKLSRPETAKLFMSPAPGEILGALVDRGLLSRAEAQLAAHVALAEDVTVEADSGGHTDNRPLTALLPAIIGLRSELQSVHRFARPIRIGAAGGIGTPSAVAAAFGLGAADVMTGSTHQCTIEAGTSPLATEMRAGADFMDVAMAPS